jgi:hypothetical protein
VGTFGATQELESSAFDGSAAELAINRCLAGFGNRVAPVAQIDRVVPDHGSAVVLDDRTRTVQSELIISCADGYGSVSTDGNRVIAIAGYDGTVAVNVDKGLAPTRNAY